jgi:hypothetical protein
VGVVENGSAAFAFVLWGRSTHPTGLIGSRGRGEHGGVGLGGVLGRAFDQLGPVDRRDVELREGRRAVRKKLGRVDQKRLAVERGHQPSDLRRDLASAAFLVVLVRANRVRVGLVELGDRRGVVLGQELVDLADQKAAGVAGDLVAHQFHETAEDVGLDKEVEVRRVARWAKVLGIEPLQDPGGRTPVGRLVEGGEDFARVLFFLGTFARPFRAGDPLGELRIAGLHAIDRAPRAADEPGRGAAAMAGGQQGDEFVAFCFGQHDAAPRGGGQRGMGLIGLMGPHGF